MRSLLSLNLDSQDLDDAIHNISQVFISTRASPVLGSILKRHCDNGDVISNVTISRILKTPGISDDILLILLKYISNTPVIHLEKIAWHQSTHQLIDIECALIRKVEGFRARIMESLDLYVEREVSGVQNGTARFAALLEGHSRYVSEENKFIWDPATSPVHKAKFLENYIRLQNQFLDENLNETQLRFFLCAVCLLPGIDQKAILDRITGDRKKSNLWASTVLLINKIVESPEELFSAKMKAWFLFSFDHLTRRFAEDSVLSEKVLDFAKRLGSFIEHRQIALDKLVPRTALNAVLEAAIVKHIQVKETVYFSTAVISQSPSKILDLPKFLQLILGNSESPLAQRGAFTHTLPEEIHGYVVYLTSKIFWASKQTASNLATMDATLELYRGTDDPIDRSLLEILLFIESHLAKSCAGRISSWKVVENAGPQPLISRARGRLNVTIDSKKLQTSIYQLAPIKQGNTAVECSDLATFSSSCMESSTGKCYDPKFLLPALTYCITSGDAEMDFQAAVDKHGVGYALVCLCSVDLTIRKMAIGYIGTVVSKIESSSSRNKTQINHLLCTVLASLEAASEDNQTQDTPLPTVVGIFLSQALQVLSNPAHFLYEKVMELLLRSPILNLYDIPYMLTLLQIGSEPHKEIAWIMKILAAGIKTPADLALYRKRNVFTSCMNLHSSPFMPERIKDKVIELVWNTAAVEGGSTTLITRNGALSWIEQLLIVDAVPEEKRLQTKMLAARLWESSAKGHVGEWSKGTVKQQLSEILQTPKNTSAV
ncbi:hypothetical protein EDC01DRAFT_610333 [Geopyxis carbonaria]|nr:hypothetical protein EDC01DRAFT_610333 [Geopyxis carbonaria]